jgi:hypothetical protein
MRNGFLCWRMMTVCIWICACSSSTDCPDGISADGKCYPTTCAGHLCPDGFACINEACINAKCVGMTCPNETACVDGACYPINCQTKNCPDAGQVCIDETCVETSCAKAQCPEGQTCIGGFCYPKRCGDMDCAEGEVCDGDRCVSKKCAGKGADCCDPGWSDCDGDPGNGCETNTHVVIRCGTCYTACGNSNGSTACTNGVCDPTCNLGWGDCDGNPDNGCETSVATLEHCGDCGTHCNAMDRCIGGSCVSKKIDGEDCSVGTECQSGFCVDLVCCNTSCAGQVCQRCDALSVNGAGKCGYVNASSADPDDECMTAAAPNPGSCQSGNCSGTGFGCGTLPAGERGQPVCTRCNGSSYDPVNQSDDTQDNEGANLCNALCKKCNAGLCTNQTAAEDLFSQCAVFSNSCLGNNRIGPDGNCNGSGACNPGGFSAACATASVCQTGGGCSGGSCVPVANVAAYNEAPGCTAQCKGCSGGACVNIPNGTQDTFGGSLCNFTHYRCNGGGACTAPTKQCTTCAWGTDCSGCNQACSDACNGGSMDGRGCWSTDEDHWCSGYSIGCYCTGSFYP